MDNDEVLKWLSTAVAHAQVNARDLHDKRVAGQLVWKTQEALDCVRDRLTRELAEERRKARELHEAIESRVGYTGDLAASACSRLDADAAHHDEHHRREETLARELAEERATRQLAVRLGREAEEALAEERERREAAERERDE